MPSVTITVSDENLARIVAALTEIRKESDSDAPDATPADVKQYIVTKVKQMVAGSEARVVRRAAEAVTPVEID